MTTLARITIALILALLFSSCGFDIDFGSGEKGNGMVREENRTVNGDFNAVSASEGLDVFISQGGEFKILVEADENIIDLIATDLDDGTLKIHTRKNIGRATKNIHVTLPKIIALNASSGSDLSTIGPIHTEILDINVSSGADMEITEIKSDKINVDSSSGANIEITGETNTLYTNASSGSGIDAVDLRTDQCSADASSGANITVNVSESLIAEASSGGNIRHTGTAKVENRKTVSGNVTHF